VTAGLVNHPGLWRPALPWPGTDSHKHVRGRVAVLAGPQFHTGAARLAARAAARCGAGWVELWGQGAALAEMAAHETAIMVREAAVRLSGGAGPAPDCLVFGPAAGTDGTAAALLAQVLSLGKGPVQLVLDADALTLACQVPILFRDAGHACSKAPILTPHAGELARLAAAFCAEGDNVPAAMAEATGCIVVAKGAETIIAAPDGRLCHSSHATPWLATAGTGDVLAGMVAALSARANDPFLMACAAVWLHGEAGRRFGAGLTAEDLITMLPDVLDNLAPPHLKRARHDHTAG
jgi:ADP-dependent NAD(P)H-hydrate dehydratase / NAD(P)H-hydrate epimerase